MKKLVLLGIAATFAINVTQAAEDKKNKATGKGGIQALLKQLDLNTGQKKKLDEFNKTTRGKTTEARKLKGDERKAKLREITVARNAKLTEILTAEQKAKLKKLKVAKKDKKRNPEGRKKTNLEKKNRKRK